MSSLRAAIVRYVDDQHASQVLRHDVSDGKSRDHALDAFEKFVEGVLDQVAKPTSL